MEAVIARVTVMTVTVIWRQLLPDWKSEMNELVDVHMFWCLYIYMFLVYVYIIMFPVQVYIIMFLVLVYICCWYGGMYVFDVRLLY